MSMTFNGIKKDYVKVLRGRERPPWAPIERNLIEVTGHPGGYLSNTKVKPRIITVPILIQANDFADLQKLKEDVADWLITNEPQELIFDDEPDRTYYAVVEGELNLNEIVRVGYGVIRFVCPDPYKYGPETPFLFPSDSVNLTNSGTADADPIFELEVLKPVTFAMVQNQNEEYMMIGRPLSVSEEVVNTKKLLFKEVGDTLDTWTTPPPQSVDGGVVSGTMNSDGAGITAPNYGTGDKWHGPALLKEVTPAQDFEVDVHLQIRTTDVSQTARVEVYLYDEGMKILGKMAIMDNQLRLYQKNGEARFGPFINIHENYLISSKNYQYAWDYWFGMLRFRRVGNEFEFYITRIGTNNKHVYSLKEPFRDTGNEFNGRLKYVQIHIGTHGSTGRAYSAKMFSVSAYELTQATEDQTPYIAYENDIIKFDHVNDELLINGENREDLKDFGGSYFKLAKGDNALVVHPDNSFETRGKYRKRCR